MLKEKFIGKWTEQCYGNDIYLFMEENKGVHKRINANVRTLDFKWDIYSEYEFKIDNEIIKLEHSDKYEGILVINYKKYIPMIYYYRFNEKGNILYLNFNDNFSYENEIVFVH